MESPLSLWRSRTREPWIVGVDRAALRLAVRQARFRLRALRVQSGRSGAVRLLCAEADRVRFLGTLFAALTHEEPVHLFLGSPQWSAAENAAAESIVHGHGGAPTNSENSAQPTTTADRSLLLVPTGGTTGGLRFAAHTWSTLSAAADGLGAWLGGGSINSTCFLPLHHVSGLMQVIRSFRTHGQLLLADWSSVAAAEFPAPPREGFVTSLVPTQLARLLESPGAVDWLRSFRAIFLGGSPAWPALLHRARAERLPLAPCYGATETAAQVCALRPEEFLAGADGVGRALPHARIEIVDERTHAPLPTGQAGGIRIASAALFRGYWPDLVNPGASYLTNDRGSVDDRGFLFVHGRIDDVINTGGEKVAPGEVEATLRSTHLVRDAAVIGVPDPTWGEIVVAVVAGLNDSSRDDLQVALRAALAPHKVPKRIIAVSAVPRTAAGKIDRATLRALIAAHELEGRP